VTYKISQKGQFVTVKHSTSEFLNELYFCGKQIVPYHLLTATEVMEGAAYIVVSPEMYDRWLKYERDINDNAPIFKVLR